MRIESRDVESQLPPSVSIGLSEPLRDYWLKRARQHTRDFYAGVPISKLPEDLRVYEHLLWLNRPQVVIELGAHMGGSALWFRDRLRTLESYGLIRSPLVVSVDLNLAAARANVEAVDPTFESIVMLEANVLDPSLPDQVASQIPSGARSLVIEDSAHIYETTLAALVGFAQFVPHGGFFIVEDGCVDVEEMRLDPSWPRGVLPAIEYWLATDAGSEFVVRRDLELYGLSCHPGGFLQRLSRPPAVSASRPPQIKMDDQRAKAHAAALAALEAGHIEEGRDLLRDLVASELDPEHLNDLAVAIQMSGELGEAEVLLRAARTIGGDRPDVMENLETLAQLRSTRDSAWRGAPGIAGHDPGGIPERAHPGMPLHATLAEHCTRYSLALGVVGGLDVLDLGCGTGYGSEMLTWSARRVRGFDIWEPDDAQRPSWPGGAQLEYGHDLCRDPLPESDAATMFEVLEHLPEPDAALDLTFRAVSLLLVSFPNPVFHGSHLNPHHVNDWTLEQVENALTRAARRYHSDVQLEHLQQHGVMLAPGRDPNANFWLFVVRARDRTSR